MNIRKQIYVMIAVVIFLSAAGICFAESAIPNLIGTWSVKAEGGVLLKGSDSKPNIHHDVGDFTTLTAEAVVTKQQGRVLHGVFKSSKATENFIAVIGPDNKSFYFADQDGFLEGKIVSNDQIEVIYRHVSASTTLIAAGTWSRKK